MPKNHPTFDLEQRIGGIVCGVDEVGRGPWAGPVMTAAVILDPDNIPPGLNDSKKLTKAARASLYHDIINSAETSFGEASVAEIDQLNILGATLLAMERAVRGLPRPVDHVLVDGIHLPKLPCPGSAVKKGDSLSLSIAAASIIAKIKRDSFMADLGKIYPEYGWDKNAGYGTRQHQDALKIVGPSRFHRRSFAPIRRLLAQQIQIRD